MNWLKKIGAFFRSLFSPKTAQAIERGIEACAPYVADALGIATAIAALTPNRTDDEILAAVKRYAVPVTWGSGTERGEALRQIAVGALRKLWPEAADSDLNRAIEIAVGALKAGR